MAHLLADNGRVLQQLRPLVVVLQRGKGAEVAEGVEEELILHPVFKNFIVGLDLLLLLLFADVGVGQQFKALALQVDEGLGVLIDAAEVLDGDGQHPGELLDALLGEEGVDVELGVQLRIVRFQVAVRQHGVQRLHGRVLHAVAAEQQAADQLAALYDGQQGGGQPHMTAVAVRLVRPLHHLDAPPGADPALLLQRAVVDIVAEFAPLADLAEAVAVQVAHAEPHPRVAEQGDQQLTQRLPVLHRIQQRGRALLLFRHSFTLLLSFFFLV